MKSKIKQNWKNKQTKNMLNQTMHKTRLTQNMKANHMSNAHTKQEKREWEER